MFRSGWLRGLLHTVAREGHHEQHTAACHDGQMSSRALVAAIRVLAVSLAFASCSTATPSIGVASITSVILHGKWGRVHLDVEEADTPEERERGLMNRTSLGPDEGMVFLFGDVADGPVTSAFWMKDTLIPLSIAFWDEGGRIVGIRDMDPCTADPCPTYSSPKPYIGALEANEGFFTEHGVTTGDRIELVD
jgi:uncharacterized protein